MHRWSIHAWVLMLLALALGLSACMGAPRPTVPAPVPRASPQRPPAPAPPTPNPVPTPPAPGAITGSKLTITLTSSQGKKAQLYLFAPDEKVRVEEAPSCMAQAGDTLRQGHYGFYLLPEGAKEPVRQNLAPFGGEPLQFNDRRPQYLTLLPGEQGRFPDVLLLQQYGSCNGTGASALALSPDGTELVPYNFVAKQWSRTIGISQMEQLGPGKFRTTVYNNATGVYTTTTWEVREAEKALVATSVEEKQRS